MVDSAPEAISNYLPKATAQAVYSAGPSNKRPTQIRRVEVLDQRGHLVAKTHDQAHSFQVRVQIQSHISHPAGYLAVYLRDQTDTHLIFSDMRDTMPAGILPGEATFTVTFPGRLLKAGSYLFTVVIADASGGISFDAIRDCICIVLETRDESHRTGRIGYFGTHLPWQMTDGCIPPLSSH
jgi:hypothetical protein